MRTDVRVLATRCCVFYAKDFLRAGQSGEFAREFKEFKARDGRPGLNQDSIRAWEDGATAMSLGMARRIGQRVKWVELIFLAIVTLLKQQHLSAPCARAVVQELWETTARGREWKLPSTHTHGGADSDCMNYAWDNSVALAHRGDIFGLLAILTLVRESAVTRGGKSAEYLRDTYLILPAVCRLSWVRRDCDLLLQCVEDMSHAILWWRTGWLGRSINWSAFREEILAPRPWSDMPPWVDSEAWTLLNKEQERPVPLLQGFTPSHRVRGSRCGHVPSSPKRGPLNPNWAAGDAEKRPQFGGRLST